MLVNASTPIQSQFRVNGELFWKALKRAGSQMRHADLSLHASALSFSTAVSIIPVLAVALTSFNWVAGQGKWSQVLQPFLLQNLIESSGLLGIIQFDVDVAIRKVVRRAQTGKVGWIGFLGLVATSLSLFFKMEKAVLRITQSARKRSLWKRIGLYFFVLFGSPVLLGAVLVVANSRWVTGLRLPAVEALSFGFGFVTLFAVYRWVPTIEVKTKAALTSAGVAAVLLWVSQEFYAQAMKGLFRISKLYGSLAGFPLFLFWIYLLWWCVLFGVALTTVLNSSKMREHV